MLRKLPKQDLVLLGAGHTNAHVIRMWRMRPIRDVRLTCVSDHRTATYSGMAPGVLAGEYSAEEFEIDLVRWCAAAGVRFLHGEVSRLDHESQRLHFEDRPPIPYDYLSIGVGSQPTLPDGCHALGLAIKPMQTFLPRLNERLQQLVGANRVRPLQIAIAGGGAGGVEIALCLKRHLERQYAGVLCELTLIEAGEQILAGSPPRSRHLAQAALREQGVEILCGCPIVETQTDGKVRFANGEERGADLVLWATGASAPPLLSRLGLQVDERGFLSTRETLQTVTSERVYAVGDSGSPPDGPIVKAGVHAVRQGPVLWENLQRQIQGRALKTWKPQASFLSLLNAGEGTAILTYKGFATRARWCRRLKDRIDRRFMRMHQDYAPMAMAPAAPAPEEEEMHCGGCGCKLPSDILTRVLRDLDAQVSPGVIIGLDDPDDVALMRPTEGKLLGVSTDFFTEFLDDPYVLGRVAALNALSDLYAKRIKPTGALAIATVPYGRPSQQESCLHQLLAGGQRELQAAGATLLGGHTTEGPQTTIGFTVLGEIDSQAAEPAGRLEPGDRLFLTKPLGAGVLLAGHAAAKCRHDWMDALLDSLLRSNREASESAGRLETAAMTDVTGFGFAGHLSALLKRSRLSAEIALDSIPLLPGVEQLLAEGVESTLAPGNRAFEDAIECPDSKRNSARYRALFDPQTSGGLLIGVADGRVRATPDNWFEVGRMLDASDAAPKIRLC